MDGPRAFYYEGRDGWVRLVSQREFDRLLKSAEVTQTSRIRYDEGDTELPAAQHPATASIFDAKIGVTDELVDPMVELERNLEAARKEAADAARRAEEAAQKAKEEAEQRAREAKVAGQRTASQTNAIKEKDAQIAAAAHERAVMAQKVAELERQVAEQKQRSVQAPVPPKGPAEPVSKTSSRTAAVVKWAVLIGFAWIAWAAYQGMIARPSNEAGWRAAYSALARPLLAAPSIEGSTLGAVARGDVLEVRPVPRTGGQYDWVEVRQSGRGPGYLQASSISDAPPPQLDKLVGKTMIVKQESNIRTEPRLGDDYVVGLKARGARAFVVGTISPSASDNIEWAEIVIENDQVRYIAANRLEAASMDPDAGPAVAREMEGDGAPIGEAMTSEVSPTLPGFARRVLRDGTKIRAAPSTAAPASKVQLSAGAIIYPSGVTPDLKDPQRNWYLITTPDRGFVAEWTTGALVESPSGFTASPGVSLRPVKAGLIVVVTAASTPIHPEPNELTSPLTTVPKDELLKPVGVASDRSAAAGKDWYRVLYPAVGYVAVTSTSEFTLPAELTPVEPRPTTPTAGPAVAPKPNLARLRDMLSRDYPASAMRKGQEGAVTVSMCMSVDGRASDVQVVKSSGVDALDQATVNGMAKLRFEPANDGNGKPVAWCPPVYKPYVFTVVWKLP